MPEQTFHPLYHLHRCGELPVRRSNQAPYAVAWSSPHSLIGKLMQMTCVAKPIQARAPKMWIIFPDSNIIVPTNQSTSGRCRNYESQGYNNPD